MGHKFSAIHGVKSDHFYEPGNAINEIWVGDVEVVSRLPFGDSDLEQAGWPEGNWPKIPWHHFIIPLKRDDIYLMNGTLHTQPGTGVKCPMQVLPQGGYYNVFRRIDPGWSICIGYMIFFGALTLLRLTWDAATFLLWILMALRSQGARTPLCATDIETMKTAFGTYVKKTILYSLATFGLIILGLPALTAGAEQTDVTTFLNVTCGMFIFMLVFMRCLETAGLWYFRSRILKLSRRPAEVELESGSAVETPSMSTQHSQPPENETEIRSPAPPYQAVESK
ncbi:hypothetical protein NUU61_009300 [Penicillium alfredii]|uniref:Uncharacterized protein n=1 Tax=Penicillium alfredii TaxID=1506179 RepID=A0A9W9JX87_9EURO|nr:uncharacterized protein NUU61_009300 [Penicillium alfredii]KAJ5084721.1 hypothetical protein NUU61_009300 [Penicillium alfredii]